MTRRGRWALWICVAIAVATLAVGVAATLDWRGLRTRFVSSVESRSEKARVTLFRLGEVLSIEAALKDRYAAKVDTSYGTRDGLRVLEVSFREHPAVRGAEPAENAREIAAFAVSQTARFDEIDVVDVRFPDSSSEEAGATAAYRFPLAELVRSP